MAVKYFDAYKGERILWFSENYNLYLREGFSKKDKKFTLIEREEFESHTDTIKHVVGDTVYYVKFFCDFSDETKHKAIQKLHEGTLRKMRFDNV